MPISLLKYVFGNIMSINDYDLPFSSNGIAPSIFQMLSKILL